MDDCPRNIPVMKPPWKVLKSRQTLTGDSGGGLGMVGKGLISTLPSTEAHTWAILFDNEIFTEYISYKKVFF